MTKDASSLGLLNGDPLFLEALITKLQDPTVLAVAIVVFTIALLTRLTTGKAESQGNGGKVVATPGYWLPYLGHIPQMAWDTDGFLAKMRDRSPLGAFSLKLMGNLHTFVHQPSMVTSLMNKPHSVADEEWISEHLMFSNFGFKSSDKPHFKNWFPEIHKQYNYLVSGPSLTELVDKTVQNVKVAIADLVTFNTYLSDQMEWERLADVDIVETASGERVVEADLMDLTKNFVAKTANPALFGGDLDKNFDDISQLIWDFDAAFVLLAMGLPSWIPWPKFQRARTARRRMLSYLEEYHDAMEKHCKGEDPGLRWQDLDSASTVVKERTKVFRRQNIPIRARASCDFGLIWAMNANANPLTFWLLYEIYRDEVLLHQIREEIAPYVKAVQPKNEFSLGVWVPPRIDELDVEALITRCPLLKSAYVETLRLYTGVWSIKWLKEGTVLKNTAKGDDGYVLQKGTYAHAPHEVHQLDPRYFPDPEEWHGARHVKESVGEDGKLTRTADLGTIRPYGTLRTFNNTPKHHFFLTVV